MTANTPHKPNLLLVDDQVLNIQILHHIFKDEYTIASATSGAQALALCARQVPDLILLDVVMPVMPVTKFVSSSSPIPTRATFPSYL